MSPVRRERDPEVAAAQDALARRHITFVRDQLGSLRPKADPDEEVAQQDLPHVTQPPPPADDSVETAEHRAQIDAIRTWRHPFPDPVDDVATGKPGSAWVIFFGLSAIGKTVARVLVSLRMLPLAALRIAWFP